MLKDLPPNNPDAAAILEALSGHLSQEARSRAWLAIGDALARLEQLEERNDEGRPWVEVLQAHLEGDSGTSSMSLGHLNKIRRVRTFVRASEKPDGSPFTDAELGSAGFSALEIAERFHKLDAVRGSQALSECILEAKPYTKLREEYEAFIQDHPDRLTARRMTWLKKREEQKAGHLPQPTRTMIERILLEDPLLFFGASSVVVERFVPRAILPILGRTDFGFLVRAPREPLRLVGVEFIASNRIRKRDLHDLTAQVEFQSSFFDRYWLLSEAPASELDKVAGMLVDHLVDRVGIVRIEMERLQKVITAVRGDQPPEHRRRILMDRLEI